MKKICEIEKLISEIEAKNEEMRNYIELLKKEIASTSPTLWIDEPTNLIRKQSTYEKMRNANEL